MLISVGRIAPAVLGGAIVLAGLVRWLAGRRLLRSTDPAVLSERWLEVSRLTFFLGAFTAALSFAVMGYRGLLAVPLVVLSLSIGAYPSRKAVLSETWGLGGYLAHVYQVALGFYAYGIALMAAPLVVFAMGSWWVVAGTLVAAALMLLRFTYYGLLRRILRARTFDEPIVARLREIASVSRAGMPRLFRVGPSGGRWANAFALPSVKASGVLFTETLLNELDSDELVAVFCHELAHLEYFDPKRLQIMLRAELAVIGVLAMGIPFLARTANWGELAVIFATCAVVLAWAWWRAAGTRQREIESDTRALVLCGNADALVSGLTKLYLLHRLPRRWSAESERRSSHPSLARRIQHIRGLVPSPVASNVPDAAAVMSATGESAIVIDHDRFHLVSAIPTGTPIEPSSLRELAGSLRSIAYSELTELRVRLARGGASLVARSRTGEKWSVPIHAADLARVQEALDRIDVRLGSLLPSRTSQSVVRAVAAVVLLAGWVLGEWSLVLVGLVALTLPGQATFLALGAATIVSALLEWRDIASLPFWLTPPGIALLAGVGVLCLVASLRGWEPPRRTERVNVAAMVFATATALAWVVLLLAATGGFYFAHQIARSHPMVVLLLAAAALMAGLGGRLKRGAQVLAALTILPLLVGSDWFVSDVLRDPLLNGRSIQLQDASLHQIDRAPIRFPTASMQFSSSGRGFIARAESEDDAAGSLFAAGVFGHADVDEFRADAATFVGEDRLLVATGQQDRLNVRLTRLPTEGGDEWSIDLPPLAMPVVHFDEDTRTWFVAGTEGPRFRRFTGSLTGERTEASVWELSKARQQSFVSWHVGRQAHALAVEQRMRMSPFSVASVWWSVEWLTETTLWSVGRGTQRRLLDSNASVGCAEPVKATGPLVCSADVTRANFFWSIDPVSGERRSLGSLQGDYLGTHLSDRAMTGYSGPEGPMVILFDASEPAGYRLSWASGWVVGVDIFNRIVTRASDGSDVLERWVIRASRSAQE